MDRFTIGDLVGFSIGGMVIGILLGVFFLGVVLSKGFSEIPQEIKQEIKYQTTIEQRELSETEVLRIKNKIYEGHFSFEED